MGRSLHVKTSQLEQVKRQLKQQGYARQQDLAEELQMSRSTVSNFLNGRPVDHLNFIEISDALQLDWRTIADFSSELDREPQAAPLNLPSNASLFTLAGDTETLVGVTELEAFEPFIYIEREGSDALGITVLQQPYALLRIKAPRLMGKTALSYRLLHQLQHQGYQSASLNFHLASVTEFASLSEFLKWFCSAITQLLQRSNRLADYWDETFSTAKMSCTDYFEQYLLADLSTPLVLCLDEIDRIFPYPEVAAEFLGLLRAWHERGKIHTVWQKLRLVLIYSTEVYIPLNLYESPFNVGHFIELPNLNNEQVQTLVTRSGLTWTTAEITEVMTCLGGHPAYLQRLIQACQQGESLVNLLQTAPTEAGIYRDELRHLWRLIARQPTLLAALQEILDNPKPQSIDVDAAQQLDRLGLINMQDQKYTFKCELYRNYFKQRLKTV
ncbi:MAG: hypothetical protein B0A82_15365 [Alkalinema sp. CACIAM 70d]|nr:MAG: hypothetical protein B0A82_15365 [Alkalinema sp. CACIAM 70d]